MRVVSVLKPLIEQVIEIVNQGSYPLIVVLMALESALIPIPSEIVMPFAGFLVQRGKMEFWPAVISGVLGNLIGSLVIYYVGAKVGWEPVEKRFGSLLGKSLIKARNLFDKHGDIVVLFGRVLPAVRTVVSLPAGLSKMDSFKFVVLTVIGSIPWNFMLVYAGFVLGENWELVSSYIDPLAVIIVLLAIIYVVWERKG